MKEVLLVISVIYTMLLILFAFHLARIVIRRGRVFEDLIIAGRTLPFPVVLGTLFATYIGGGTLVGWTGSYYKYGFDWWFYGIGSICGTALAVFVLAKRVRHLGLTTLPEILERRYDIATRMVAAVVITVAYLAIYAVQIIALGSILMVLAGLSKEVAFTLCALAFVSIALAGGLFSVAFTDTVQALLMGLGLSLGGIIALSVAGLGVFGELPAPHLRFLGHFSPVTAIGGFLSVFGIVSVSQCLSLQRFAAARSSSDAYMAGLFLLPALFLAYFFCYLMGTSAYAILGPGVAPGKVFPEIMLTFPIWLAALMFATAMATIVTSANSLLISGISNLTWDFSKRLFPRLSYTALTRIFRALVILIGIVIALPMALKAPDIINALVFAYTIYTASLFIPLYGGFWKRANSLGAILALIGGAITAIVWEFILGKPYGIHTVIPGFSVALILMLLGTLIGPKPPEEKARAFYP